jgi:hypothetical protein
MILFEGEQDEEEDEGTPLDELQTLVTRQIEEAANWRGENLDSDQAEATKYYKGEPFGNEEAGRSRVVTRDVKQVIQAMLPSLMRIFFGPDKAVEFRPRSPEDVQAAEQQTDYVNYVIREDNKGFLVIHGAFKDAMVRKIGVIKWWWEEKEEVSGHTITGIDEQQLAAVMSDEEVTDFEIVDRYTGPEGIQLFDCEITRTQDDGKARIDVVAGEHFFFSPNARSLDEADIVAHIKETPASEVIAMGFDEKDVMGHRMGGQQNAGTNTELRDARRFDGAEDSFSSQDVAPEREEVLFGEAWIRFDLDGDGKSERIKCFVIGEQYEILSHEKADDVPFALFCPDPEPNTLVGESVADDVKDIQKVKSSVIRGMLDSLTLALNPRQEVVEGEVNIKDVMNTEMGGVIRVLKPGMYKELIHDFARSGGSAFPMLAYLDQEKEDRTGISKAAAGLDADALQSATKAAVAATLSGSQQHIEMLARVFAETGMTDLYAGVLRLVTKHQDRARMIRLRNEWVEVDPRSWNASMDVKVNLALGKGSSEEQIQLLQLVAGEQKEQLMQGSPLVTLVEYRNTLSRMVELAGFANPQEFFKPYGEKEAQAAAEQAAQAEQKPSTEEQLIQLEQAKLQLDAEKAKAEDDRKRDEMTLDFAAKIALGQLQYGGQIAQVELKASVDAANNFMQADLARRQALPDDVTPERHPNDIGGGVVPQ